VKGEEVLRETLWGKKHKEKSNESLLIKTKQRCIDNAF